MEINRYGGNLKLRLKKLNEIYEIIKENDSDYNKAAKLLMYFYGPDDFQKSMQIFIINGKDDPKLNVVREALDNYDLIYNTYKKYKEEGFFDTILSIKRKKTKPIELKNQETDEIITINDIDEMLNIINSNLEEEKKAENLYEFCNETNITKNLELYNTLSLNETEKLKEIIKAYKEYGKKNLFKNVKNKYKCTQEELNKRLDELKKMNEIMNSNDNEYHKVEKILSIFESTEEFRKKYHLIIKYGIEDEKLLSVQQLLKNYEKIYNKFKEYEEKGIVKKVSYILSIEDYIKNYEYAKFIIENYLKRQDSYKEKDFLDKYGIDKEIFEYCVDTIHELDINLYKRYLERKYMNNKIKCLYNSKVIHNLAIGILKGKLPDGTKLDIFEFVKRLPYKRREKTMYALIDFMKRNNKEDMDIILKYMQDNGLTKSTSFTPLNINKIYEKKITKNKIELTKEDKDNILDYLRINNIPLINKTFTAACAKFFSGEITNEMIYALKANYKPKEKVIIIPSKTR